jgi:hypothetical protein
MSRPKPKVLLSYTDPKSFQTEQVIATKAIYVVFYDGQPINLKSVNQLHDDLNPKYRRVTFPESPGHAFNLCDKLNAMFKTDKFEVFEFKDGVKIPPTSSHKTK